MADAERREERVDGSDLDAVAPAVVPERGGVDVVASVGNQEWQGRKALDDPFWR